MADDKAGNAVAEKAATESTAAAKSGSQDGSARPSDGVQKRIDELTGELGRKDAKIAKLEAEQAAEAEKRKTEDEKRVDQLVNERITPYKARLESIEGSMRAEYDELVKAIPDGAKSALLTGENIPIEERLRQARSLANLIGRGQMKPSFEAGAAPGSTGEKRTYTREQFRAWQNMPGAGKVKEYEELRDEMSSAYREGRITGLGG